MTCNDCIHYDVCYRIEHYGRIIETDKPCGDFKNKADYEEVVRCKDCKHKVEYCGCIMCGRLSYNIEDGVGGLTATIPEHFCSYGQKK